MRVWGFRQAGTFRTKAQAERWAVTTEDQFHSASFRDTGAAECRLLSEHLAWCLATLTPRKALSALSREASSIRILSETRAQKICTLATVSTDTVLRCIDDRKRDGVSSDTIIKEIGTLFHALDAGVALLVSRESRFCSGRREGRGSLSREVSKEAGSCPEAQPRAVIRQKAAAVAAASAAQGPPRPVSPKPRVRDFRPRNTQ